MRPASVAEVLCAGGIMPSQDETASTARRPGRTHEPSGRRQESGSEGRSPSWPARTERRSAGESRPTTDPYSSTTKESGTGCARNSSRRSAREVCSMTVGAGCTRSFRQKAPCPETRARLDTGTTPRASSVAGSRTGSQESPVREAKRWASGRSALTSSQLARCEGVIIKRAVRPERRMTRPTISRSSGAKAVAPEEARATASMGAESGEPPPSMLRITRAVASRMLRILTRRLRFRRAY